MAGFAIVIGIMRYEAPGVPVLPTTVEDALRMAAWLLDPGKGKVPPSNLYLLLSPTPPAPPGSDLSKLPPGHLAPATRAEILRAILDIRGRAPSSSSFSPPGERLFFYYAGHGLQSRITMSNEDAIVPVDYTTGLDSGLVKALSVSSILRFFEALPFPEQFFVFDCCRNMPDPIQEIDLERVPPNRPDPERPEAPSQFVFNATAPGQKSLDDPEMLTGMLLDGLEGKGQAKTFTLAGNERRYEVRASGLFEYIRARFAALPRPPVVGGSGTALQLQKPRLSGDVSRDAVLATFPEASVAPVPLAVTVEPQDAWGVVRIDLLSEDGTQQSRVGIQGVPVLFRLPPRSYAILVQAPSWSTEQGNRILKVYEDTAWSVRLSRPAAPAPAPAGPEEEMPLPFGAAPAAADVAAEPGSLTVTSDDALATLEVVGFTSSAPAPDTDGKRYRGLGRVECSDLPPGIYRARLTTPEGQVVERVVPLGAGESPTINLEAPHPPATGLLREVIERARFAVRDNDLIELAERAGAVEVLLAVETTPAGTAPRGQVVLDEPAKVEVYLKSVRVGLWPLDGAPGPLQTPVLSPTPGLASLAVPASPGPYWLSLRSAAAVSATFAVVVLEGHSTQLVLHQGPDGHIQVFQFFPGLRPEAPSDPEILRRLDLAQRFLLTGQRSQALGVLDPLLESPAPDALAGCLGGHLLMQAGQLDRLDALALGEKLVGLYPALPDAHALLALHRAARGREDQAQEPADKALDVGLPFIAAYLERLSELVARVGLRHPRGALLGRVAARLVPGLLWSAWLPEPGGPANPDAAAAG